VAGARAWILKQLDTERSRWMLWLPVALGRGNAIYFELPTEPTAWLDRCWPPPTELILAFLAPVRCPSR
jgi:competence protein ComEC